MVEALICEAGAKQASLTGLPERCRWQASPKRRYP